MKKALFGLIFCLLLSSCISGRPSSISTQEVSGDDGTRPVYPQDTAVQEDTLDVEMPPFSMQVYLLTTNNTDMTKQGWTTYNSYFWVESKKLLELCSSILPYFDSTAEITVVTTDNHSYPVYVGGSPCSIEQSFVLIPNYKNIGFFADNITENYFYIFDVPSTLIPDKIVINSVGNKIELPLPKDLNVSIEFNNSFDEISGFSDFSKYVEIDKNMSLLIEDKVTVVQKEDNLWGKLYRIFFPITFNNTDPAGDNTPDYKYVGFDLSGYRWKEMADNPSPTTLCIEVNGTCCSYFHRTIIGPLQTVSGNFCLSTKELDYVQMVNPKDFILVLYPEDASRYYLFHLKIPN